MKQEKAVDFDGNKGVKENLKSTLSLSLSLSLSSVFLSEIPSLSLFYSFVFVFENPPSLPPSLSHS
jgi:hypothetical protein